MRQQRRVIEVALALSLVTLGAVDGCSLSDPSAIETPDGSSSSGGVTGAGGASTGGGTASSGGVGSGGIGITTGGAGGTGTGGSSTGSGGVDIDGGENGTGGAASACLEGSACTGTFGGGVCNGGKCVQCVSDTSCPPTPTGGCKVRHCDTTTMTCEPQNAQDHADCALAGRTGVCQGGACTSCIDKTDCQKLAPSTPVCSAGNCVECTASELSACSAGTCRKSTCDGNVCGESITTWASCSSGRVCNASGACATACNNGHLDAGEECEPGLNGWFVGSCDATTCARTLYRACKASRDCVAGQNCAGTNACTQSCTSNSDCVSMPGTTAACYGDGGGFCVLGCSGATDCPTGLACIPTKTPPTGKTGICVGQAPRTCDCTNSDCTPCLFPIIGP